MVWENDPKIRAKQPTKTHFYINKEEDVIVGDMLLMQNPKIVGSNTGISTYTITEVVERRRGAMSGKDYVEAVTEWSNIPHDADSIQ